MQYRRQRPVLRTRDERVFHPGQLRRALHLTYTTLVENFAVIAERWGITWKIHDLRVKPRLLLMVSRFGHCLNDLLFRYGSGTLRVEIPAIVSNHRNFHRLAGSYDIPFYHLPVTADTKAAQEARLLPFRAVSDP